MRRRYSPSSPCTSPRGPARGVSLVIAMLMLAVIGLCSAAVMRGATSAGQVSTNHRLLAQAGRNAQVGLRFCEGQLTQPAEGRTVAPWPAASAPAWTRRDDWTGGGSAMAYTLAARDINAGAPPRVPPQCLLEATATADVYTVTARGFSPDFSADARTGATRTGSVVWLQSTVLLDGPLATPHRVEPHAALAGTGSAAFVTAPPAAPAAGPPAIRQRVWQQLLTPPF